MLLSSWGNYPYVLASVTAPTDMDALRAYVLAHERITVRGNGKSYGDAALGPNILSTLALRRIRQFEPIEGIIDCEAGVLLSELLPVIVPAGWFFHVTPGIKNITVGGAIASDVHGKNHPAKGCFSNWLISFELLTETGAVITCSRTENAGLFWQTCGGMGWTGIILSARFQLMRLQATQVLQHTHRCKNFEEVFKVFEDNLSTTYAAGWLDTTATGTQFGRGAVHLAEHLESADPLTWNEKKTKNIPFFAPSWTLNPWSIRVHNAFYFRKNQSGEKVVDLDAYFYPLDRLRNWNRLYGRRGLVQYQFCLPQHHAFEGIRRVMELVRKSRETPFLSVLKRHGERPKEAIHSFPIKGYSLALDFPRTSTIFELVHQLDECVWGLGGKIYLTKDACSAARMGWINPDEFSGRKFSSALRERINA